jgi:hypothetical protein
MSLKPLLGVGQDVVFVGVGVRLMIAALVLAELLVQKRDLAYEVSASL